jgi:hypothetical protein
MKVEVVREEVKEYVLRLDPREYRDLLILFTAPQEVLWDTFSQGAESGHIGHITNARQHLIDVFKQAGDEYKMGSVA